MRKRLLGIVGCGLLVLTTAAGCPKPGTVINRDSDCKTTREDTKTQVCTYQLRTQKGTEKSEWFEVTKRAYDQCDIGHYYPDCADKK